MKRIFSIVTLSLLDERMSVPPFANLVKQMKERNVHRSKLMNERVWYPTRSDLIFVERKMTKTMVQRFTWRDSPDSSSRFSKLARREAAVDRRGRPTGPPQDGSMPSPTTVACCPSWTLARHPDARTPSSGTLPCRGPRPEGTASADSRPVSRLPAPPPFVSCNTIEWRCSGLINYHMRMRFDKCILYSPESRFFFFF